MNYSALIQNRKSFREFTDQQIPFAKLAALEDYYNHSVRRLVPEIRTELHCFGPGSGAALEGPGFVLCKRRDFAKLRLCSLTVGFC